MSTEGQRRSRKQERDGAVRHGGTVNSRSGAGDLRKNDVRTEDTSIEFKTTASASYRLSNSDLYTAWRHATADGRKMIFGIELPSPRDAFRGAPTRWAVMPEDDYLALRERVTALEGIVADQISEIGQELREVTCYRPAP